jgi:hypothetical protein
VTNRTKKDSEVGLRLVAYEGVTTGSAALRAAAAARVHGRLAEHLEPLIGVAGFRALFARSLKLARTELPCLGAVVVAGDPPLTDAPSPAEQLEACLRDLEPAAAAEAAAALFGTLVGLLTSFIGERLVLQVLRSAFPGLDESPYVEGD